MDSPTEESSSLETTFSTDSPSSGFLDQAETSQEGKHNQAKTRIEEIDKLNKKLEIKLLSAPKDQVNQPLKFFNFQGCCNQKTNQSKQRSQGVLWKIHSFEF
jgi:hypothetical protein